MGANSRVPRKDNLETDLEPLIKCLSIDDPMSTEEYLSVDADVPTEGDEEEEQMEEEPECEEDESVLTYKEAFNYANKLSVYTSLHGLHSIMEVVDHSRTNFLSEAKNYRLLLFS